MSQFGNISNEIRILKNKGIIMKNRLLIGLLVLTATAHFSAQAYSISSTSNITIINGKVVSSSLPVVQDAGEIETKQINISNIRDITLRNIGDLTIEQCRECPEILTIMADKNIMPYLEQQKDGKRLTLQFDRGVSIATQTSVKYHAVVKDLEKISLSEATSAKTSGKIETSNLALDISGASKIDVSIDVDHLRVDASGASEVTLSGKASDQEADISGATQYRAKSLINKRAHVDASGASEAQIYCTENTTGHVSGASQLDHYGPAKVNVSKSGVSKVRQH